MITMNIPSRNLHAQENVPKAYSSKEAMACGSTPWSWWCVSRRPAAPADAAPPALADTAVVVEPPPPQGHQPPPPPAAADAAALVVPTGAPDTAVGVATAVVATAVVAAGTAPAFSHTQTPSGTHPPHATTGWTAADVNWHRQSAQPYRGVDVRTTAVLDTDSML